MAERSHERGLRGRGRVLQHAADAVGGRVAADTPGAGLLRDMAQLDGPMFRAADLHPDIRAFYEHTSQWHMEVRTRVLRLTS